MDIKSVFAVLCAAHFYKGLINMNSIAFAFVFQIIKPDIQKKKWLATQMGFDAHIDIKQEKGIVCVIWVMGFILTLIELNYAPPFILVIKGILITLRTFYQ